MKKDPEDTRILETMIREQNAKGARLPIDLDDRRYKWSNNGRLEKLFLMDCGLRGHLSLGGLNALTTMDCINGNKKDAQSDYCNHLESLDVSGCPMLDTLYCTGNDIKILYTGANIRLERLWCSGNQLTSLDVSSNPALKILYCLGNQLTELDVSSNPVLKVLDCSYNALKTLDVSANHELSELWCHGNGLTEINLGVNLALKFLFCKNNQLAFLDTQGCPLLKHLECDFDEVKKAEPSEEMEL